MNEVQRLPGNSIPLAVPVTAHRGAPDLDPVGIWRSFAGTLMRRRLLFASIVLGVIAVVAVVTLLTPPRYTVDAKMIAGNPNAGAQNPQGQTGLSVLNAMMFASVAQSAETYAELISETPVVQNVIKDLHLNTDVRALQGAVKVKPVTNTNIITVQVSWSDPDTAALIANDFATVFVKRQAELVAGQATGAMESLGEQLPVARANLSKAEAALSRYQTSHNIADLTVQTGATLNAAASIDAKINAIQLEKQQSDAAIASLSGQLAGMKSTVGGGSSIAQNPVIPQLRAKLADLKVQLGTAQQQFTDSHPQVINLKQQIADTNREIARQSPTILAATNTIANPVYQQLSQQLGIARATSASDSAQLTTLSHQRAAINPQLSALPGQAAKLAELKRNQKLAEDVYNALQQKYNDATVSRATGMSDVTITQRALAALATKSPHLSLNLMIATVAGLLLGLSIVFLVDWFDDRIRDERDVEELQLPVLASVPQLPSGDGAGAVPATVRNAALESYFQLVLAMRYSSDHPLRSVTFTSPLKGDGKSTVAMNVAAALGEIAATTSIEREARVLIVDADMRRPSLHKKFEVTNEIGLSDILIGRASLSHCVKRTDRPGVDILTSGTHSPNPIKLLQSPRFDAMLSEARARYEMVIVDAPALVPVFDAAIIAAQTDGTVMILSAGQTDIRSTRKALARLESVGVRDLIGTVVNRSTTKVEDYNDYFAVSSGGGMKELPHTA